MSIKYSLHYDGDKSIVSVPELEGRTVLRRPSEVYYEDLNVEMYQYMAYFDPYDAKQFTTILIQKAEGDGESVHGTGGYERLTREEADNILASFIGEALDLDEVELETDSEDFAEDDYWLDEDDEEEEEED